MPTASCFNHQTVLRVTRVPHFRTGSWGVQRMTRSTKEAQLVSSRASINSRKAMSRAPLVPTPDTPAVGDVNTPELICALSLSRFGPRSYGGAGDGRCFLSSDFSNQGLCTSVASLPWSEHLPSQSQRGPVPGRWH